MKRIIEIDESLYNRVQEKICILSDIPCLCKAVDDSKPYSEPTGDLISRSALKAEFHKDIMGGLNWKSIIDNAPAAETFTLEDMTWDAQQYEAEKEANSGT